MQNQLQEQDLLQQIPLDLFIINIFPNLPPKTLSRFKTINKSINHHISSQKFTTTHLLHSLSSAATNRLLIFHTAHRHGVQQLYSLDLNSSSSPHPCPPPRARHLPLPTPFRGHSNHFDVVGSCHGIVCLRKPSSTHSLHELFFMFLNPSTGKARASNSLQRIPFHQRVVLLRFGFGYDNAVDHEYKFVVFVYHYFNEQVVFRDTIVYGLNGFSFRYIETSKLVLNFEAESWREFPVNGVLLNNSLLHWVNKCSSFLLFEIVCFNLKGETWVDNVPLPDFDLLGCNKGVVSFVNLGVFDDCLCLSTKVEDSAHIDVWVMKKYGVKDSWMKLNIAEPCCRYIPLFANGSKELLLSKEWPHKLGVDTCVRYNFEDGTNRMLEFSGGSSYFKVLTVSHATLVHIYGGCRIWEDKKETSKVLHQV